MKPLLNVIALVFLSSCTYQAFIPFEFNPQVDDNPVMSIEADDLVIFVENVERKSNLLVFDLEVQNNTDKPLLLDTKEFYYYSSFDEFESETDGSQIDHKYAYNQQINRIN